MNHFNKIFFRGLVTLLPIAITVYIFYSAILILENFLGSVLKAILPASAYIPGLGVLATLAMIFALGLMLNNYIADRLLNTVESYLKSIPLIKAIYSPMKDLMNLFSKNGNAGFNSVVLVKMAGSDAYSMGLITRENFRDLEIKDVAMDRVAVFFPFSYGLGGYTFLVPRDKLLKVDLPVEKAMSLAITGWVKVDKGSENSNKTS